MTTKIILPIIIFTILVFLFVTKIITLDISFHNPFQNTKEQKAQSAESSPPEEIIAIKAATDIKIQGQLYRKLIDRVGIEQAQEELYRSGMPFDGQTHLLNHVAGDYLYEKEGNQGLSKCKEYFLSSCYHGFVLRVIGEKGFDELSKVMEICKTKGPAVVSQCSHAIGHGLLTYNDYPNLIQALKDCDKLKDKDSNFPLFNCHDGVFMENIWGVHDGKPSPDRWIKDDDPYYPCNDPRIPQEYINACWAEQPTVMYTQFKGDIKKIGEECDRLTNSTYKATCFDALARQIHPIVKGSVDETFNQCQKMPSESWNNACVVSIARAFFSVGDLTTPFEICNKIQDSGKKDCYQNLLGYINYVVQAEDQKQTLCNKISDQTWKNNCQGMIKQSSQN